MRWINGSTNFCIFSFQVLAKVINAVVNKKITKPGSFIGYNGTPALTCSHKAASGFVYPLERGMIFIYKPPIYLRYEIIVYYGALQGFSQWIVPFKKIIYSP